VSETPGSDQNHEHGVGWRRPIWLITAVCLMLLALAGVGTTAFVVIQSREYTDCQRGYNEDVVRVLRARAEASDLDRAALRQIAQSGTAMIDVLLKPGVSLQESQAAIKKWRDDQLAADGTLAGADQKRADNPLPTPRSC